MCQPLRRSSRRVAPHDISIAYSGAGKMRLHTVRTNSCRARPGRGEVSLMQRTSARSAIGRSPGPIPVVAGNSGDQAWSPEGDTCAPSTVPGRFAVRAQLLQRRAHTALRRRCDVRAWTHACEAAPATLPAPPVHHPADASALARRPDEATLDLPPKQGRPPIRTTRSGGQRSRSRPSGVDGIPPCTLSALCLYVQYAGQIIMEGFLRHVPDHPALDHGAARHCDPHCRRRPSRALI
jgi:hypothetical protein